MGKKEKKLSKIEQAGEDLFNYAIDREEVKWLMANLAEEADIFTFMTGSKMFTLAVGRVKEYLEAIKLR